MNVRLCILAALAVLAIPLPPAQAHNCVVDVQFESVACKCPAFPLGRTYTHVIAVRGSPVVMCWHDPLPVEPDGGEAAASGCLGGDARLLVDADGGAFCESAGLVRPGDPALDPAAVLS